MKELKLIPPTDPRVQTVAPFTDDMLKEHDFKDRKELTESMFELYEKISWYWSYCQSSWFTFQYVCCRWSSIN